jgi:hypothetical protein
MLNSKYNGFMWISWDTASKKRTKVGHSSYGSRLPNLEENSIAKADELFHNEVSEPFESPVKRLDNDLNKCADHE